MRDLGAGAAVSQELPLSLSAETYVISAELRMPPPPPMPSPRGKPRSPRPPMSPRGKAPKPQAPAEAARQAQQADASAHGGPHAPASPRGKAPKPQTSAEAPAPEPCDPAGPLLDFGVLRVRDEAARLLVLANTGRHAIGFSFFARTQVRLQCCTMTMQCMVALMKGRYDRFCSLPNVSVSKDGAHKHYQVHPRLTCWDCLVPLAAAAGGICDPPRDWSSGAGRQAGAGAALQCRRRRAAGAGARTVRRHGGVRQRAAHRQSGAEAAAAREHPRPVLAVGCSLIRTCVPHFLQLLQPSD